MKFLTLFKRFRIKFLIWFGLWSLIVFVFVAPLLNRFINELANGLYQKKVSLVSQSLQKEQDYLLSQTKQLIDSGILNQYIEEKDIPGLLTILNEEQQKRQIGLMLVTDSEGTVLTRTKDVSKRGDYVFNITPWGRALSRGEIFSSIEYGKLETLTVLAAGPINNDAGLLGALVTANEINNDYAKFFKQKYLRGGIELIFYSKSDGIVGSTFSDLQLKKTLFTYFNTGSEWLKDGLTDKIVRLGQEEYYLKNLIFPGLEKSPGGVMVLFPSSYYLRSLIFALVLTLIFLFGVIFYLRLPKRRFRWQLILFFVLVVLIGSFVINLIFLEEEVFKVKEVIYSIYNSELKLEPEFDILNSSSSHRLAIKLLSGGEAVNAFSAVLTYDPAQAAVEEIIFTNSFCNPELVIEKSIDENLGEVHIACVVPSPGFIEANGTLAELLVKPLKAGDFSIRFGADTKVLANDGLGTNVLRDVVDGYYYVYNDAFEKTVVFSTSHPNGERWYNSKSVRFEWVSDQDQPQYHYLFNEEPSYNALIEPTLIRGQSISLNVEHDGVYYFYLIAAKGTAREFVSRYKVKVDATPPLAPEIKASATKVKPGDVVRVVFESHDASSGLQKSFYVKVDEGTFLPLQQPLFIAFVEKGIHAVIIRAFDRAGNFSDNTVKIEVAGQSFFNKVVNFIKVNKP